jgi:alpha-tubulin suppressor-like RCC1 family protein
MLHSRRVSFIPSISVVSTFGMALISARASAGTGTLQSIVVTPAAVSVSVGQRQTFKATGTFNDASKQWLGPALANVGAGYNYSCALLVSGGVECWGYNANAQLGDGNTQNSLVARPVKGIGTATAISDGEAHSCALLADGTVQCWGSNSNGELGDGTIRKPWHPVQVSGITTATAVAAGTNHSCALLASGEVECWGSNALGQLGDGSNTSARSPVLVGGISTATAIAAGWTHSCALLRGGTVKCWGDNSFGALGNGNTTSSNLPVTVSGISTATAIVAGAENTCALLASGRVKCWGEGAAGNLGNGANADSSLPVFVSGITTARTIAAGYDHVCAIIGSGAMQCWGYNGDGELGDDYGGGNTVNTPVAVLGMSTATKVAAGVSQTCALLADGTMQCWGGYGFGQLGDQTRSVGAPVPINVQNTPGVLWSSSNPTVATINARGMTHARAVGNTTITATTAAQINDNAVLTVK